MDIRNFLVPKAGARKAAPEAKPAAPSKLKSQAAKVKPQPPKPKTPQHQKKPSRSPSKTTKGHATSPQKKKSVCLSDSDDEVEIISNSDEEDPLGKKVNGKREQPVPASKKAATVSQDEKGQLSSKLSTHSKTKEQNPSFKGKKMNVRSSEAEVMVSEKQNGSRGRRDNKKDSVDSDSMGEEESPIKTSRAAKSKRRSHVIDDSEEEAMESEKRKHRKSSKRKKMDSDEELHPKKKGHRIMDSDSEAEEMPQKKKAGRKRKTETIVLDDSDEDKAPRKGSLDTFVVHNAPQASKKTEQKSKPMENKKSISAVDFFGSGTVHRTERTEAGEKRKVAETVDPEFHDDDDFMNTLGQLNKQEAKRPRTDRTPVKDKTDKEGEGSGTSLASKLSMRMKTASPVATSPVKHDNNSNLVPDTPDFRTTPRKGRSGGTPSVTPKKSADKGEVAKDVEKRGPPAAEKKTPLKSEEKTPLKAAEKKTPLKSEETTPLKSTEKKPPVKPTEKKTPLKSANKKNESFSAQKEDSGKGSAKQNWRTYRNFLNREGPSALGSKEIPTGADNCLEGLTFVITGIMESIERDEAKSLVERYGGKVTTNVSKRTSYLVVGRDAGASKINKAEQLKTKQIDEDGLLELIRTKPGKKSKYQEKAEQDFRKEQSLERASSSTTSHFTALKGSQNGAEEYTLEPDGAAIDSSRGSGSSESGDGGATYMWVDKYKPASMKQIIGQQGDKSNARKLLKWIQQWHQNRAAGVKPAGRFGQDDGSGHRAALLSGPPGIGKTTTAVLVCKEAEFSTVELNASDKRSKRSLKEDVAEALNNQTLVDYMGPHEGPVTGHHHCLIMDEVDGMAGNEDRGGLQELVQLIKTTKIPVICICNDRNSMKMRTLANYCLDLRFQRPRLEQIKGALMSIAYKEGVKMSAPALQEIILSCNQDIRQCIHNMSMFTSNHKELTYDQAKQDAKNAEKDVRLGIFDVCRKIFAGGEEAAKMSIHDKSDLFFQDYSFVPLFVHENYITVTPYAARGDRNKHLSLLARTAESISDGDLVDRRVRGSGNWNLLPTQAMHASVIPGEYMRGSVNQMIQFPQWLGRYSTTTKYDRILQELRSHMALKISSDKRSLNMDYLPALRCRLTEPLASQGSEGVPKVIQLMDSYDVIKDDYDNILDITKWPNSKDPWSGLDPKTKAAFTRQYNKECHLTPYATGAVKKKRGGGGGGAAAVEELTGEGEEGAAPASDEEEEDDSVEKDTMIKAGAASRARASSSSSSKGKGSSKGDSGKGKGPAKGKGQGKGRR